MRLSDFIKSISTILVLGICAIPAFLICAWGMLLGRFKKRADISASGRTILLTGGKMTKCLQLARLFHLNGDRVIVAETKLYKWAGTRFSKSVQRWEIIPDIIDDGESYINALVEIAKREKVDVFVPVASPKAAYYDALAKPKFPEYTTVFHFDDSLISALDDKHQFITTAKRHGLSVPKSFLFNSKKKLLNHQFEKGKRYVLKKIEYDPVFRMDLRPLPHEGWQDRVKSIPIGKNDTWVLQEFIEGDEYCTHATVQHGQMKLYVCSISSPFQVNYQMEHIPQIKDWVQTFVSKIAGSGQLSFDFILDNNGRVMPIECNPRTHSAITLFHNQPKAISAYSYKEGPTEVLEPNEEAGHTFWWYHEMYRLLNAKSLKKFLFLTNRLWSGKEAVFQWYDPWPFFFNNHLSIPYQIMKKLRQRVIFERIDFNIGKIIYPGGD